MKRFAFAIIVFMITGCTASLTVLRKPIKIIPKNSNTGIYKKDYKISGKIAEVGPEDTLTATASTWLFYKVNYDNITGFIAKDEVLTPGMHREFSEEQKYYDEAMACPLIFELPNSEAEKAWARAQSFIGRFSPMKLQIATDYILQTYTPTRATSAAYGYYVTRTPLDSTYEFEVNCVTDNPFLQPEANENGHLAAYYIKTGQLKSKYIHP